MTYHFRPVPWAFAVLACTFVLVLAVLPPFVGPGFRHALMQGFDLMCHQIPERSFQIGGIPLALCHRCTGVVAGLVIGALALVGIKKESLFVSRHLRTILLLSIFPMAIDWGVDVLGIWTNVPVSRLATGLVFGIAAGYTFARALAVPQSLPSPVQPIPVVQSLSHPSPTAHAQ